MCIWWRSKIPITRTSSEALRCPTSTDWRINTGSPRSITRIRTRPSATTSCGPPGRSSPTMTPKFRRRSRFHRTTWCAKSSRRAKPGSSMPSPFRPSATWATIPPAAADNTMPTTPRCPLSGGRANRDSDFQYRSVHAICDGPQRQRVAELRIHHAERLQRCA